MQATISRVALALLAVAFAVSVPTFAADEIAEAVISASGVSLPHPVDALDAPILAE
jgi:hypothetical protein